MVQYYAMLDHWKYNGPPVHMSVAAYLGLVKERPEEVKVGNLNDLAAMFSGSGGMIQ